VLFALHHIFSSINGQKATKTPIPAHFLWGRISDLIFILQIFHQRASLDLYIGWNPAYTPTTARKGRIGARLGFPSVRRNGLLLVDGMTTFGAYAQ
jgi:hypothetical protein